MTKRQVRNAAHKSIFKEGKTHTQTFLDLQQKTDWPDNSLADLISGIPSKQKHSETKPIWTAYLGILGLVVLFRLTNAFLVFQTLGSSVSPNVLLPDIILSLFIPAYGIYAVLKGIRHMLYMAPVFLIIGIFRVVRQSNFRLDWDNYIMFGLIAGLLLITIILWNKWKTPYSKKVEQIETENGTQNELRYQFEDDLNSNSDILDDSF